MIKKAGKVIKKITIGILIVVFGVFSFSNIVYAQDNNGGNNNTKKAEDLAQKLNCVNNVFSWSWLVFANFAGKLMSNDVIYEPVFDILKSGTISDVDIKIGYEKWDTFLWKMWNFSRGLANMILMLFLLFYLFSIIFKDDGLVGLKKNIVAFLVGGVVIQLSWFFIGAFLDLVNIATAAVTAIPYEVVSTNESFSKKLIGQATKIEDVFGNKILDLKLADKCGVVRSSEKKQQEVNDYTVKELLDSIMPDRDNFGGPLEYFGWTLYENLHFDVDIGENDGPVYKILIQEFFNLIFIGLFTISLLVLTILNFIRVFVIWIFIIWAPIGLLLEVFSKLGDGSVQKFGQIKDKISGSVNVLDVKKVFQLMIKPIEYMLYVSLSIIIVTIWVDFSKSMANKYVEDLQFGFSFEQKVDDNEVKYSNIDLDGLVNFTVAGLKYGFGTFFVGFILVYLMWTLVKLSLREGEIGSRAGKMIFDSVEKSLAYMPVVPIGGGVGVKAFKDYATSTYGTGLLPDVLKGTGHTKLASNVGNYLSGNMDAYNENVVAQNFVNKLLGVDSMDEKLMNDINIYLGRAFNRVVVGNSNLSSLNAKKWFKGNTFCPGTGSSNVGNDNNAVNATTLQNTLRAYTKEVRESFLKNAKKVFITSQTILESSYLQIWFVYLKSCKNLSGRLLEFNIGGNKFEIKLNKYNDFDRKSSSNYLNLENFVNKFIDTNAQYRNAFYQLFYYLYTLKNDSTIKTYQDLKSRNFGLRG